MPDDDDIFAAFDIVDELLDMAPADDPPEHKHVPSIPGRTNPAPFSLQKLAKDHTEQAFNVIFAIMNNPEAEFSTRLEAAKQILDRGWGKPAQQIKQEMVKIELKDVEARLLLGREDMDARIAEAKRIEEQELGRYITVDPEVVTDVTPRSESTLPDYT